MPGNHTKTHMQVNLRILPTKIFFFFQGSTVCFPPFFIQYCTKESVRSEDNSNINGNI